MMEKKIAIIGIACRFPGGVKSLEDFWQLLCSERDAVSAIPPERFGTAFYQHPSKREPGKSYTFAAGVLDDVAGFDAAFFGVSPREAAKMDPQHRLLLELAWETFEDAGVRPATMRGSNCGVFVGIAGMDYGIATRLGEHHRLAPVLVTDVADFAHFSRLGWLVEYLPRFHGDAQAQAYRQHKQAYLAWRYRDACIVQFRVGLASERASCFPTSNTDPREMIWRAPKPVRTMCGSITRGRIDWTISVRL